MAKKSRTAPPTPVNADASSSASDEEDVSVAAPASSASGDVLSESDQDVSDEETSSESETEALSSDDDAAPALSSPPSKKRKRAELEPLPIPEDEDAPALSHAEKRRQKKKQQLETGIPGPSAPAINAKEATRPEVAVRTPRQHSIWVGNLSFRTTEADLRKFFADAGEVTRVNLPLKPAQAGQPGAAKWASARENRGFAYVDFSSKDAKVIAITMSEGHLDGRKLLIKDGDDFAGRPKEHTSAQGPEGTTNTKFAKRILGAQKQPPAPTLFLGNLSFETTEASIKQMFDAHRRPRKVKEEAPLAESEPDTEGKQKKDACIRKVRLGTFEDSGLCKGWAFVDFTTVAEATAALTNPHNYELDGRTLKVEYASADAVRRGAAKGSVAGAKPRPEQKVHDKPLGKGKYDRDTRVAAKLAKPDRGEIATPQDDHAERPAKRQKVLNESEEATRQSKAFGKGSFDRGGQSGLEKGRKVQEMRRGKDGRMRPAPGAALAMAKRESVGIVPSQGTKIKF